MMTKDFLSEKSILDLDLDFVFQRIAVVSPYGHMAKKNLKPYLPQDIRQLQEAYDALELAIWQFENKRQKVLDLKLLMKEDKNLNLTFDRIESDDVLSITELYEIKHLALLMVRMMGIIGDMHWTLSVPFKEVTPITQLLDPDHSGVSAFFIYSTYSDKLRDIRIAIDDLTLAMKQQTLKVIEELTAEGFKVTHTGDVRLSLTDLEQLKKASENPHLDYKMDIPMYRLFKVKADDGMRKAQEALQAQEEDEEYLVRAQLTKALKGFIEPLRQNVYAIGELDYLIAKAQFMVGFHCVRPQVDTQGHVSIMGGRDLKVSYGLEREGKHLTPVDICLSSPVTVITGANMGGKTVSLRMIGQVVAMAQLGFFVPCQSATLSLFDFIYVSVGDSQSVDLGLSTFGAEMKHLSDMLKRSHERGLVLIDELARGTNPSEGYAISRALIEAFTQTALKTVMTTHYDGLTQITGVNHYQVNGLSGVQCGEINTLHALMDYRLTRVDGSQSIPKDALKVSEWMGLPHPIIERAKHILGGSHDK